mgnify:CR=1 FL=1
MKALITGASSGLGKDFAFKLSNMGYDLILVSRNKKELNEVASNLKTNVRIETYDLSNEENCIKLFNKHRKIDLLINNAGFGLFGEFSKTNLDKELNMIDLNVKAVHILTKLYLKEMIKKDSGKILNVASIAGFMPGPLMTTYYSTKNYVVRFSESIREELRRKKSKVQISILCPGPVDTNFNKVADVEFALKGLSSEYVAKYAINKFFKGKFYIVPGWKIKLARIGAKLAPASFVAKISYNMQKRKIR